MGAVRAVVVVVAVAAAAVAAAAVAAGQIASSPSRESCVVSLRRAWCGAIVLVMLALNGTAEAALLACSQRHAVYWRLDWRRLTID